MSSGNSDMAGNALGTTFSLLLLASIIQGLQVVELFHYKTKEAVEGQNITLPCIVQNHADLKIVSIEWSKQKNEGTKLALYSLQFGERLFWPNVTIQIQNNHANELIGSYLHLPEVKKWDSGIYICDVTTFPLGSIRTETELTVKDGIIMCDVDGTVEVHNGENVTIRCRALPNAQYRWTTNKRLVSENESLELWWVNDANAGVYTLTVNTGNKTLHKDFIITVLTATTSLRTDVVTASPQGLTESADSRLTTSPSTEVSTHVNWTTSTGTDNPNTSNVTITAGEHKTTVISVTSSPATYPLINSTTPSYGSTVFSSTQEVMASDETRTDSKLRTLHPHTFSIRPEESSTFENSSKNPAETRALSAGSTVRDKDTKRSHLMLVLIIVPALVLIAVAGFLYRRQIMKKRMDLPPPFKPPPPPIKYTAAKLSETPTECFPTSRCNSVIEPNDMKQMFITI